MEKQGTRVVLASQSPQVRDFLSAVIEKEDGVEVVGQAQNVVKALTMVRNLRPDVVVIDCYLPHSISLDSIPLSRVNGLDAAQAIHGEIPNTKVILLNNLDTVISQDRWLGSDTAIYAIESNGIDVSLASQGASPGTGHNGIPLFAGVEVKRQEVIQQKATNTSDIIIFFGALGFAGGWLFILTMILAPVGVLLAALGAVTVIVGLLSKLTTALWRKRKNANKPVSR